MKPGAHAPLGYLWTHGAPADSITHLIYGLIVISLIAVVVITVLVLAGSLMRRTRQPVAVHQGAVGTGWVTGGVVVSIVALIVGGVWTLRVLSAAAAPPPASARTIEITANQWWWQARYLDDDPSRILTTANEIHVPVGQPVILEVRASDVIHSFFVPKLLGKIDVIPGQTNRAWFVAHKPGRYIGTCAEFCGLQHANMRFAITADYPAEFAAWYDHQLTPARTAETAQTVHGQIRFEYMCGTCHTARGTGAGGLVAPDLTHLMTRKTIAAGALPNNAGNLAAWIADPETAKPGTRMPVLPLSGSDINDIRAFLMTLD